MDTFVDFDRRNDKGDCNGTYTALKILYKSYFETIFLKFNNIN